MTFYQPIYVLMAGTDKTHFARAMVSLGPIGSEESSCPALESVNRLGNLLRMMRPTGLNLLDHLVSLTPVIQGVKSSIC